MKLLHKLMISCQKASVLVHKRHNEGLTRGERLKLSMHTSVCAACRTAEKQTEQIEKAIRQTIDKAKPSNLEQFKSDTISKLK